jgi:hypothetical protein
MSLNHRYIEIVAETDHGFHDLTTIIRFTGLRTGLGKWRSPFIIHLFPDGLAHKTKIPEAWLRGSLKMLANDYTVTPPLDFTV